MYRALVIEQDAANKLNLSGLPDDWFGSFELPQDVTTLRRIALDGVLFIFDRNAQSDARLLIISGRGHLFFPELPKDARLECFFRILRVGLSRFQRGINIPIDWRTYHSGSLISFQSNRLSTRVRSRVYVDLSPQGTDHVYAFSVVNSDTAPLTRTGYDVELFEDAALLYLDALAEFSSTKAMPEMVETSIALTRNFADSNIAQGVPYSVWRDSKLTSEQLDFFNAPFGGPLRVRGAAGTGKTVVLTMRFLKEIYARLDVHKPVRAAFIAHGEETAEHIRNYLMLIDERNLLFDPPSTLDMQITTLHGIASEFINVDSESIQPLSLDGTEGRMLQLELVRSLARDFANAKLNPELTADSRPEFRNALRAAADSDLNRSFCVDLIDEFANVLEALGTREVDEIADKYVKLAPSPRGLGQTSAEKQTVMELYRGFRNELAAMGVVSLDQFTSDFLRYLQSFRWEAIRSRRGFDFVFADELHLFNRQERPVLGYLLKEPRLPRVAIAYDPRQSPRNSFFPEARRERDNIWAEARLDSGAKQFELTTIFRYTPQILAFMKELNHHFPADDLSEEWGLPTFSKSRATDGPMPKAYLFLGNIRMDTSAISFNIGKTSVGVRMGQAVADRARELANLAKKGERVAVLCLDPERFSIYRNASTFDGFTVVSSRDEIGSIQRHQKRAVLSMPEYVAGLQFDAVLLLDANAMLIPQLGSGLNGVQRFVSSVYLGASRAKRRLEIYADASSGGFAQPIREAIHKGLVELNER